MMDYLIYSAIEAAKMVRTDPEAFNKKLEAGEIPAYKEGRNWKIPKTLLVAYIENKAMEEAKERRGVHEEVCVGSE